MSDVPFRLNVIETPGEWVVICSSPHGGAVAHVRPPFSADELQARLSDVEKSLIRSASPVISRRSTRPEQVTQAFGRELSKILLEGDLGILFDRCREKARQQRGSVRVLLDPVGPNVCRIPWELAVDPVARDDYLALRVPVARSLHLMEPVPPLRVEPPLRVLGVMSRPSDLPPLEADQERARISQAFQQLSSEMVSVEWLETDRWHDLARRLQAEPWHILHFIGHGGFDEDVGSGYLELTGDHGQALQIPASELAHFIADNPQLRLVVLNACESATAGTAGVFSSTAARLMKEGVPAVVAMQYEITDPAALTFGCSFYEEIAHGVPVDRAVTRGREAVMATLHSLEWATPVLFLASDETQIFSAPESPTAATAATAPPRARPEPPPTHAVVRLPATSSTDWSAQMRTKLGQFFKGVSGETGGPAAAPPPSRQRTPEPIALPGPPTQPRAPERTDDRPAGATLQLAWASDPAGKSAQFALGPRDLFALACADGFVRVVSLASGREKARCCLPRREAATGLAWSPWPRHLASLHDGGLVVVWDLETEVPLHVLTTSRPRNTGVAFSNDGKWLAVASDDRSIRVFGASGAVVQAVTLSQGPPRGPSWQPQLTMITCLAFTADDRNLLGAGDDGLVRQFDVRGQLVKTWRHPQAVSTFAAGSSRMSTASLDGRIHVWSWDGALLHRTAQGGRVTHAAYSDDELLATLTRDGRCDVWDREGSLVGTATLSGTPIGLGFASSHALITSTSSGAVQAWSLGSLQSTGGRA